MDNNFYLIIVTSQLTNELDMLLSDTVHFPKKIVLHNSLVLCSIGRGGPLLSHALKVWAHLEVSHQCYLHITKQWDHRKLL